MLPKSMFAMLAGSALAMPTLAAAESPETHQRSERDERHFVRGIASPDPITSRADERLAIFTPTSNPIRHRIDYEIWDYALKNILVSMGPSTRQGAPRPDPVIGSRLKSGPQSRFRLEGSLVMFRFFDKQVIDSFTEYRQDL